MRSSVVQNVVLSLAVIYSLIHFVKSSGAISPSNEIRGDFSSGFPNFWAWRLNPSLIQQNPDVLAWMGKERVYLSQDYCDQYKVIFPLECKTHKKEWVTNKQWLYGPTPHLISFPLLFSQKYHHAYRLWWAMSCIFFVLSAWIWYQLLIRPIQAPEFLKISVFLFIWCNFAPAYEVLHAGEIEALQFFLLSACIYSATLKKEVISGLFLGFAVMTKFIPVVFIPYFFWKKKIKLVAVCLLSILVLAIAAEIIFDWRWNYTLNFIFSDKKSFSSTLVQTFSSWIYRFFTEVSPFRSLPKFYLDPPVSHPFLAECISTFFIFVVVTYFCFLLAKYNKKKLESMELSILFVLMVTLVKWNHFYYLIVLLVPFTIVARELIIMSQLKTSQNHLIFLPLLSYFLVGFVFPGTLYQRVVNSLGLPPFRVLYDFYSVAVWGYSLLLIWLFFRLVKSHNQESPYYI